MPQTIKLKRSATAGNVPTTAQLDLGEVAINTNDGKVFFKKDDGTAVILEIRGSVAGTTANFTTGTTAPTDPTPVEGDLWYDTTNDTLMVYNGTGWEAIAGDKEQSRVTTSATAPTTRADGSALQAGDTYYNTTDEDIYVHDGTAWRLESRNNIIEPTSTAPTVRDNGEALQAGDIYWDTGDSELFVYNGSQWSQVVTDISTQSPHLGSSATVLTQRPNGETLAVGDIYYNTADSEMKVYTGITGNLWMPIGAGGGASVTVSDTAPATATDGDLWYNTTDGRLYVYVADSGSGSPAWIDAAPALASNTITASDTAPTSPSTGDGWLDTATSGQLFIWNGSAWIAAVGGNTIDSDAFVTAYNNAVTAGGIDVSTGGGTGGGYDEGNQGTALGEQTKTIATVPDGGTISYKYDGRSGQSSGNYFGFKVGGVDQGGVYNGGGTTYSNYGSYTNNTGAAQNAVIHFGNQHYTNASCNISIYYWLY